MAKHSHHRSHCCASRKWGSLTSFTDQKIVEGWLAWQVGTGGQVSSGCGKNVEEDGLAKTGRMAK